MSSVEIAVPAGGVGRWVVLAKKYAHPGSTLAGEEQQLQWEAALPRVHELGLLASEGVSFWSRV